MKRLRTLLARAMVIAAAPVAVLVLVPVVLVAAPVLAVVTLRDRRRERRLRREWERAHGRHGRRILFVHSDSPNWRGYLEAHVLPRIAPVAVTLNWSRRSELAREGSLEWRVFETYRPGEGFNPAAIVIPADGEVQVISFRQAFRDRKHGKEHTLRAAEAELFRRVEALSSSRG